MLRAASFLCVLTAGADPLGPGCAKYRIFMNDGTVNASYTDRWLISPTNNSQTGVGCTTPGCAPWNPPFPMLTANGTRINGGVPQAGNLTLLLDYIKTHIDTWLPDPAYPGNAVFDFEAWAPQWNQNIDAGGYHSKAYQTLSLQLMKEAHPSWSEKQVLDAATAAFEAAAMLFLVQALETAKALRPHAAWGYWDIEKGMGKGGELDDGPMAPMWKAQTGFFPSIYLKPGGTGSAGHIAGVTATSVGLRNRYAPHAVVRPFAWAYYVGGGTIMTPADMAAAVQVPAANGADGVMLWGAAGYFHKLPEFAAYLNSTLGPISKAFIEKECPA